MPVGYVFDIVSVDLIRELACWKSQNRKRDKEEREGTRKITWWWEDAPLNALLLHVWLDPGGHEREYFCNFLLRVLHLDPRNLYLRSRTEKMGRRSAQDVWRKDEVSDFQEFAR